MIVKPKYVFQADAFNLVQREFSTRQELYKFIQKFDFRSLYDINGKPIPWSSTRDFYNHQFRVGACIDFEIDGYQTKSIVIWGPEYYVGRSARLENNTLTVDMPVHRWILDSDRYYKRPNRYYKEYNKYYEEYEYNKMKNVMVYDPVRMRQVYPPCNGKKSELTKFVQAIEKQKYIIEKAR